MIAAQEYLFSKGLAMPLTGQIKIGICDTGVQGNMNQFTSGQVLTGTNALKTGAPGNVDSDPGAVNGHGTFCASLMAGKTNDGLDGIGFLPGATIVPVDIFNGSSSTSTMTIIKGIQYLQGQTGVKFVNLSVNGSTPNTLNADSSYLAATDAFNAQTGGCIFNAAGNDGGADNSSPDPSNQVVEACDSTDQLASFSNFGKAVSLSGCGVNDGSCNKAGTFFVGDGTSFATPSCCAIAAMISYANPSLGLTQIIAIMKDPNNSVKDSNGVPVPNALKCVQAALP